MPVSSTRSAGVLYLVIIVLGLSSEILVRSALFVPGDAAATAANVAGGEGLFRLSIAADAIMAMADVALAYLLWLILGPVAPVLAALAAVFRLIQTSVIAGNLLNQGEALLWLTGELPAGATAETAAALGYRALELHSLGYDLGLIFFGVASVFLAAALWRATPFPRWLAGLLAAAGLVYLAGSFLRILAPGAAEAFQPAYLIAVVAETALAIRLLTLAEGRVRARPVAA